MDEDSEQINTIIGALEQLYGESQHLLSRYKTQVEMEADPNNVDPILAAKQHFAVYDSVTAEWKIIRMIYEMLVTTTQEESADGALQSIESILLKLATGQVKFQYYEFQVPYQINQILNSAKSQVILFLKSNSPEQLETNEFIKDLVGLQDQAKPKVASKNTEVIDVSNVKNAAKKFQSLVDSTAELTPERKLLAREVTRKGPLPDSRLKEKKLGNRDFTRKVPMLEPKNMASGSYLNLSNAALANIETKKNEVLPEKKLVDLPTSSTKMADLIKKAEDEIQAHSPTKPLSRTAKPGDDEAAGPKSSKLQTKRPGEAGFSKPKPPVKKLSETSSPAKVEPDPLVEKNTATVVEKPIYKVEPDPLVEKNTPTVIEKPIYTKAPMSKAGSHVKLTSDILNQNSSRPSDPTQVAEQPAVASHKKVFGSQELKIATESSLSKSFRENLDKALSRAGSISSLKAIDNEENRPVSQTEKLKSFSRAKPPGLLAKSNTSLEKLNSSIATNEQNATGGEKTQVAERTIQQSKEYGSTKLGSKESISKATEIRPASSTVSLKAKVSGSNASLGLTGSNYHLDGKLQHSSVKDHVNMLNGSKSDMVLGSSGSIAKMTEKNNMVKPDVAKLSKNLASSTASINIKNDKYEINHKESSAFIRDYDSIPSEAVNPVVKVHSFSNLKLRERSSDSLVKQKLSGRSAEKDRSGNDILRSKESSRSELDYNEEFDLVQDLTQRRDQHSRQGRMESNASETTIARDRAAKEFKPRTFYNNVAQNEDGNNSENDELEYSEESLNQGTVSELLDIIESKEHTVSNDANYTHHQDNVIDAEPKAAKELHDEDLDQLLPLAAPSIFAADDLLSSISSTSDFFKLPSVTSLSNDLSLDFDNFDSSKLKSDPVDDVGEEYTAPPVRRDNKPKKLSISGASLSAVSATANNAKPPPPAQQMAQLRELTSQVRQRRKEISSVLLSEKDQIMNLTTAYENEIQAPSVKPVASAVTPTAVPALTSLAEAPPAVIPPKFKFFEGFEPVAIKIAAVDPQNTYAGFEKPIIQVDPFSQRFPDLMQALLIPLNGMFDLEVIVLSQPHVFGRNNVDSIGDFHFFESLVVSRKHCEIFAEDNQVFLRDVGSSSGTFKNNIRIAHPGHENLPVPLVSGDFVQLGKDFIDPTQADPLAPTSTKKRCVKMQVIIVKPNETLSQALKSCQVELSTPVNQTAATIPDIVKKALNKEPVAKIDGGDLQGGELSSNKKATSMEGRLEVLANELDDEIPRSLPQRSFLLSFTVQAGRINRLQLTDLQQNVLFEVQSKKWDEKCRVTVEEVMTGKTFEMFLANKIVAKNYAKFKAAMENQPWHVVSSEGMEIGQVVLQSELKTEIYPTQNGAKPYTISVSGDFKEQKVMIVQKWPNSRKQTLFGQVKGRHVVRKNLRDTVYLTNFDIQPTKDLELVLGSVLLSCLTYSS